MSGDAMGFTALLLVDAVIALTVLEALLLLLWQRRSGRGLPPAELLRMLAPGLALMLAVRAGLAGAGVGYVAAALGAAGLLHAADLRRRWR